MKYNFLKLLINIPVVIFVFGMFSFSAIAVEDDEPEVPWPTHAWCSHACSDLLTLTSIITGGASAVEAYYGNGDEEYGLGVTSVVTIVAAGLVRGLADYFEVKASNDYCNMSDCRAWCRSYACCCCKFQDGKKQCSEIYKGLTYAFYLGSFIANGVSFISSEVEPVADLVAVTLASAAVFSNKNTYRYASLFLNGHVEHMEKIVELGNKPVGNPLINNISHSLRDNRHPQDEKQEDALERMERADRVDVELRKFYSYLKWEHPIREISSYFFTNRSAPIDDATMRKQINIYNERQRYSVIKGLTTKEDGSVFDFNNEDIAIFIQRKNFTQKDIEDFVFDRDTPAPAKPFARCTIEDKKAFLERRRIDFIYLLQQEITNRRNGTSDLSI